MKRRGGPQKASGAEKKKLGMALGRLEPKKGAKIGGQNRTLDRFKMSLGVQEAPRGRRGAIFDQF